MKAIVHTSYGSPDVLRCEEVAIPVAADDQVLIRVRASSVNPIDWHFMRGEPYLMRVATGLKVPKHGVVGFDVAGVVEGVGKNVTRFKPGDEVFGAGRGTFAEYAVAPQSSLAIKPPNVPFDEAGGVTVGAMTALQALRDAGRLQRGQKVLINGAGGGVGTFAVQIARHFGADVTGVCSTQSVDLVRSLGADHVLDYTKDDFTRRAERYDLILDNVGNHSFSTLRRVLTPKGTYVAVGGQTGKWIQPLPQMLAGMLVSMFASQRFAPFLTRGTEKDYEVLRDLLATGAIKTAIGRRYTLSEAAEAVRYVESGHARGKAVLCLP